MAAWLPIRAIVLLALYLHRAAVSEWNQPLHVMNQFLSPWVLLVMLAPPILLAWRWVRLLGDAAAAVQVKKQAVRKTQTATPAPARSPAKANESPERHRPFPAGYLRIAFGQVSGRGRLLPVRRDSRRPRAGSGNRSARARRAA